MLTQDYVREMFEYIPETGDLVWRKTKGAAKAGKVVKSIAGPGKYKYKHVRLDKKSYKAHRVIWLYHKGSWPEGEIDHINHNPLDNRIENLREATRQENSRNCSLRKGSKSGFPGVVWYHRDSLWQAQITVDGENIYLGRFTNKQDAVKARKQADKHYGFHKNHGV